MIDGLQMLFLMTISAVVGFAFGRAVTAHPPLYECRQRLIDDRMEKMRREAATRAIDEALHPPPKVPQTGSGVRK